MNQVIENLLDISHVQSHDEDMANFASSITSKYGISARTAIPAILAIVCVYIYVKRNWRSKAKPMLTRSKSLGELYGGDLALQRLFDYNEANVNPATLDHNEELLKALLEEEHLDWKKLQSTMAKLEMSGREDTAVSMLKKAVKSHAGKPHQAYEIEMLLAEMLIYTGEFKDALECECLKHEEITDARRPLFKAVAYIMEGNTEKAKECWEEFTEIRRQFIDIMPAPLLQEQKYKAITNYKQFKKKVKNLKILIEQTALKKKSGI